MTAAALVLEKSALDLLTSSIASLFSADDAGSGARAKLLVVFGRVEALRLARSRTEFDTAFDLLAARKFVFEILRTFSDPGVLELVRAGNASELAGKAPIPRDAKSAELLDDVIERAHLFAQLGAGPHGQTPTPNVITAEAVRVIRSLASASDDLGAWFVAAIGLTMAAYGSDDWDEWMVGALWTAGRRSLMDLASECGVSWETAVDQLTTSRDRRLAALPFDQAASDRASKLLGLQ